MSTKPNPSGANRWRMTPTELFDQEPDLLMEAERMPIAVALVLARAASN
jgi:hypothetical protein